MTEISSPETADRVLDELSRRADDGCLSAASIRDVATSLGIGRQTALNALRRLERDARIVRIRRGTGDRYPTTWKVL